MQRSAQAEWKGSLRTGHGHISTESGAISGISYSFSTRFREETGSNPEELIAAAHASCYSMALAAELEKRNLIATIIDVKVFVKLEKEASSWSILSSYIQVSAQIPGASAEVAIEAAGEAKKNCPVSKLLNAEISMDFHLISENTASMH